MAWIESHSTLRDHPKLNRLCRALKISKPAAIGHLHLLWWWTMEYCPTGDLSPYDEQEVADAAGWTKDPHDFVLALLSSGFADPSNTDPEGRIKLHDWEDYGEKWHRRRQANAERMRNARAKHVRNTCDARAQCSDATEECTCETRAEDVQDTCANDVHARVKLPDQTRHDQTRQYHDLPNLRDISHGCVGVPVLQEEGSTGNGTRRRSARSPDAVQDWVTGSGIGGAP